MIDRLGQRIMHLSSGRHGYVANLRSAVETPDAMRCLMRADDGGTVADALEQFMEIDESGPRCRKCEIEQGLGYCRCEIAANH